jgi:hypothetical protein
MTEIVRGRFKDIDPVQDYYLGNQKSMPLQTPFSGLANSKNSQRSQGGRDS